MAGLGSLVSNLLNGKASWKTRLAQKIKLISPQGDSYEAYWIESPRSIDKKLAVFKYPNLAGNIVQDLDVDSTRYDLTFFFEGINNDIEARLFFESCKQRGLWDIEHPIHGFLGLQLVSVTENDSPVKNGNITEISSSWIEPIDPITLKTAADLAGELDGLADALNNSAGNSFLDTVTDIASAAQFAVDAAKLTKATIDKKIGDIASGNDEISKLFKQAKNDLDNLLSGDPLDLKGIAAKTQELISLPIKAANSTEGTMDSYNGLSDGLIDNLPSSGSGAQAKNEVLNGELALTGNLAAYGQIVKISPLKTRSQAIGFAQALIDKFSQISNALDSVQDNFAGSTIDEQYFSQSQSYSSAVKLIGTAVKYLITSSFSLKVEKRFTLTEPRTPIDIAITEYGNDSYLDLLIDSNGLKGKDILLLPAGREIVVYV